MSAAPNPKPSAADKRGYGSLASLYTAFSTDFARFALELCVSEGHSTIMDPFAGMGTVGEAGRRMPIKLLLNDLNPFASLSSVFRTSAVHEIEASIGAGASSGKSKAWVICSATFTTVRRTGPGSTVKWSGVNT